MQIPPKIPLYVILSVLVFCQSFLIAVFTLLTDSFFRISTVALILSGLISGVLVLFLKPLEPLLKHRGDVESGRFAGEAANSIKKTRAFGEQVRSASGLVRTAASQIGSKLEGLLEGSLNQTELLERASGELNQMNTSVQRMAGESQELSRSLGTSMQSIDRMTGTLGRVTEGSNHFSGFLETTTGSVGEMSGSISKVSESITKLKSHAEEASLSMREFEKSLRSMEKDAEESAAFSEKVASDGSGSGMKAIEDTVNGIKEIEVTVSASADVINRLGERSKDIGRILEVINEVTKQTNLLALNAAILAAQAGEHGKGFSVVAGEIKSLANQSAKSTKEIEEVTRIVQQEAIEAVEAVRRGSKTVKDAIKLSIGAGDALIQILQASKITSEKVRRIQQVSSEQSRGIERVIKSMESIIKEIEGVAGGTRAQKAGCEELLGAISELREIALEVRAATDDCSVGGIEISTSMGKVKEGSDTIASAAKEQGRGNERLVAAIDQIREIAQRNIKMGETVREVVEALGQQAEILQSEAGDYKV